MIINLNDEAYRDLIHEMSELLPMHGLTATDVNAMLRIEDLQLVARYFGGVDFIHEAMKHHDEKSGYDDGFEQLAIRLQFRGVDSAEVAVGLGLAVMARLYRHACRQVLHDVVIHRLEQRIERDEAQSIAQAALA